jgi:hypothetical protein
MLDAQERVQVALNLNLREEVLIEKARPQAAAGCHAPHFAASWSSTYGRVLAPC